MYKINIIVNSTSFIPKQTALDRFDHPVRNPKYRKMAPFMGIIIG